MGYFDNDNDQFNGLHMSLIPMDKLGASEYTLVTIVVDESGSVYDFRNDIEKVLVDVVRTCSFSPRADQLMVRVLSFNDKVREVHGFRLLQDVKTDDYQNVLRVGGTTAILDAMQDAVQVTVAQGKTLQAADYNVNAIIVVVTDGEENASRHTVAQVVDSMKEATRKEVLESLVPVLIGVNAAQYKRTLTSLATGVGFQYVDAGNVSPANMAILAQFVSGYINSQSQSLGTGGPSSLLTI